jgi:hypothetical protein
LQQLEKLTNIGLKKASIQANLKMPVFDKLLEKSANKHNLTLERNVVLDGIYEVDYYVPQINQAIMIMNSYAYFPKTNIMTQDYHEQNQIMTKQAEITSRRLINYKVWNIMEKVAAK